MKTQTVPFTSKQSHLSKERKRALRGVLCLLALVLTGVLLGVFVGKPMVRLAGDTERFRAWVDASGAWGRLAFVGMMAAQIIAAFIPGEPFEIAAGCVFGALEGTALCVLGALLGGTAVFLLVRRWGVPLVDLFFPVERIRKMPLLANPKRLNRTALALFLLPGTPKDILTYCAGLTEMKLTNWLFLTSLARLPSIVTSTVAGDALVEKRFAFAAAVFLVTALVSVAGICVYRKAGETKEQEMDVLTDRMQRKGTNGFDVRVEAFPACVLYGLWTDANDRTAARDIPKLAERYCRAVGKRTGEVFPFYVLSRSYCEATGSFELFIGSTAAGAGLSKLNLPAGECAVLTVRPRLGFLWGPAIGAAKRYVYTKWMPASGYRPMNLEYELHTERSVGASPCIDIRFAVEQAPACPPA